MLRQDLTPFLILWLAGCATPQKTAGPQMAADKVAIVRLSTPTKIGRARFEKVDGEIMEGGRDRIEIPAGKHTVELSYTYGDGLSAWSSEANCTLTFNAEGGHVYQVSGDVDFKKKNWTGNVKDLVTNNILDLCNR